MFKWIFCWFACYQLKLAIEFGSRQKMPILLSNSILNNVHGSEFVFKHQELHIPNIKHGTQIWLFHPFEVVGRGSETQFQVGEMSKNMSWWLKSSNIKPILRLYASPESARTAALCPIFLCFFRSDPDICFPATCPSLTWHCLPSIPRTSLDIGGKQ